MVLIHTRKYIKFPNYEDLQQEGRIAILSAMKSYVVGKGMFFHWAHQYIKTKIARTANKHSDVNYPMKEFGGEDFQPIKLLPVENGRQGEGALYHSGMHDHKQVMPEGLVERRTPVDYLLHDEIRLILVDALASLPIDDQNLLESILEARTAYEVADEMGLPYSAVAKRKSEILKKLRNALSSSESLNTLRG
jgi:RNA polymerase sigma factor (sigma-70 family)